MLSKISFLAVLALGAYLSVASYGAEAKGLMCYACNASCPSPVKTSDLLMVTCPENDQCMTFTFTVPDNKSEITWRGCNVGQSCDQWNATYTQVRMPFTSCSTCNKSHCNSGTKFAVPFVALVASFLAIKLC